MNPGSPVCADCNRRTIGNRYGGINSHPLEWQDSEDKIIADYAGYETPTEIAERCTMQSGIKRTRAAVFERASNSGVSLITRGYGSTSLAYLFGVDQRSVAKWMEKGNLKYKQWGYFRVCFDNHVEEFIRSYPWFYDAWKMHGKFKALAEVIQKKDSWLTLVQLSAQTGLAVSQLQRACQRGIIEYERRPGANGSGLFMVRGSHVKIVCEQIAQWNLEARERRLEHIIHRKGMFIQSEPKMTIAA